MAEGGNVSWLVIRETGLEYGQLNENWVSPCMWKRRWFYEGFILFPLV